MNNSPAEQPAVSFLSLSWGSGQLNNHHLHCFVFSRLCFFFSSLTALGLYITIKLSAQHPYPRLYCLGYQSRQNSDPWKQTCLCLIPRTYKTVTLHSKMDFARKFSTSKWKDYYRLSRWAKCHQSQGSLWDTGRSVKLGGAGVLVGTRLRRCRHKPRNVGTWRSWKRRETASPGVFRRKLTTPCAPYNPFQYSDLQNCQRTNLCCFKPLSRWHFVTEAIGNQCRKVGKNIS